MSLWKRTNAITSLNWQDRGAPAPVTVSAMSTAGRPYASEIHAYLDVIER